MDWKAAVGVGGVFAIAAFVSWSILMKWLQLPIFAALDSSQTFVLSIGLIVASIVFFVVGAVVFIKNDKKGSGVAPQVTQSIEGDSNEQAAPTPNSQNSTTIRQSIKGSNNKQSIGPKNG